MSKYFKCLSVKSIQTEIGTKPHKPLIILKNAVHLIMGQPLVHIDMHEVIGCPVTSRKARGREEYQKNNME